jgi:hypothetical protein
MLVVNVSGATKLAKVNAGCGCFVSLLVERRQQYDADGRLMWRGLRVRIGMSYGFVNNKKPLNTGRADYFGVLPNGAARVSALAAPGQVRTTCGGLGRWSARNQVMLVLSCVWQNCIAGVHCKHGIRLAQHLQQLTVQTAGACMRMRGCSCSARAGTSCCRQCKSELLVADSCRQLFLSMLLSFQTSRCWLRPRTPHCSAARAMCC